MDQSQNNALGVDNNLSAFAASDTRVLVTGGTGFLGAYILKNLVEKGIAVRAIRRS